MRRSRRWTIVVVIAALACVAVSATAVWAALTPKQVKGNRLATQAFYARDTPVGDSPNDVLFDGTSVWTANGFSNNVTKLNPATGAVVGTYAVGAQPMALAFDGTCVWTANYAGNSVTKVNAATGARVGTYPVGKSPVAIAFDGTSIWTADYAGNSVTKVNAATGARVGTYSVGLVPVALSFARGYIWVANYGSGNLMKVSSGTGAVVGTYALPAPGSMVFDGFFLWVSQGTGSVTRVNVSTGAASGTILPLSESAGLALDQPGYSGTAVTDGRTYIWVACPWTNTLEKWEPQTRQRVAVYAVGDHPIKLAFDGTNMWVAQSESDSVAKIRAR